jgi:hypothetical protein
MRRIHMEWRGLNKKEQDLNEMLGRFETQRGVLNPPHFLEFELYMSMYIFI